MKKKLLILLVLAIIVLVVAAAVLLNRPYKPTSFVADGEIFSAIVENGSTLILDLDNDSDEELYMLSRIALYEIALRHDCEVNRAIPYSPEYREVS